jgi:hypothetical protein
MARSITLELFRPSPAARQALGLVREAWSGLRPAFEPGGLSDWQLVREADTWMVRFEAFGQTISLPLRVPEQQAERLQAWLEQPSPLAVSLHERRGRWLLTVTFRSPRLPGSETVIGVDPGVAVRAAALEPRSGRSLLIRGKARAHRARHYDEVIARLESAGARRAANRIRAKKARFLAHRDRTDANALLRFARQFPRPVLRIEAPAVGAADPAAVSPLIEQVATKAARRGIRVETVAVRGASQRCSTCGSTRPGQRRGRHFHCSCGHRDHADLNAARNVATMSASSPARKRKAGGRMASGQAVGTAVSRAMDVLKGHVGRMRSPRFTGGHAPFPFPPSLDVKHPLPIIPLEEKHMASLVKDLTDTSTKYLTGSLDNLKTVVDRTTEELGRVDLLGATKRVLDLAIDRSKDVVKLSVEPDGADLVGKAKAIADGGLEAAKDVLSAITEENKKSDLLGIGSRVVMENVAGLRNQVDLTIEATQALAGRLIPGDSILKPAAPARAAQPAKAEAKAEAKVEARAEGEAPAASKSTK